MMNSPQKMTDTEELRLWRQFGWHLGGCIYCYEENADGLCETGRRLFRTLWRHAKRDHSSNE